MKIIKAFRLAKYKMESLYGHRDYKKILIITRSRTGSNLLVSFLNSHPKILMKGEELEHLNGKTYQQILAKIFSKQPNRIEAMGFKLFYCHPFPYDPALSNELLRDLSTYENIHVIHLKRRNILRTLTSRKIALEQNIWTSRELKKLKNKKKVPVSFEKDELLEGFEFTRGLETEADEIFARVPKITVSYEDLIADRVNECQRVFNFLGLENCTISTDLSKQNPESLRTLILNYDELKAEFSGTKWDSFFQ